MGIIFVVKGFFFFFWHTIVDLTNNLLAKTPNQAQWQKANMNFTYTPLGLNPVPFKSHNPRKGYISEPSPHGL
jgi:hypothetical protein